MENKYLDGALEFTVAIHSGPCFNESFARRSPAVMNSDRYSREKSLSRSIVSLPRVVRGVLLLETTRPSYAQEAPWRYMLSSHCFVVCVFVKTHSRPSQSTEHNYLSSSPIQFISKWPRVSRCNSNGNPRLRKMHGAGRGKPPSPLIAFNLPGPLADGVGTSASFGFSFCDYNAELASPQCKMRVIDASSTPLVRCLNCW